MCIPRPDTRLVGSQTHTLQPRPCLPRREQLISKAIPDADVNFKAVDALVPITYCNSLLLILLGPFPMEDKTEASQSRFSSSGLLHGKREAGLFVWAIDGFCISNNHLSCWAT